MADMKLKNGVPKKLAPLPEGEKGEKRETRSGSALAEKAASASGQRLTRKSLDDVRMKRTSAKRQQIAERLAASIAEKLRAESEAYRIVKLLPNNLRALVERAREQNDSTMDIIELCLRLSRCIRCESQRRHSIVELRIWTSKSRTLELPYEISYIKSFGSGYLRLRYLGGELDLRSLSLNLVDTVMPRLVPMSVIEELVNNITKTVRILSIVAKLLEQR